MTTPNWLRRATLILSAASLAALVSATGCVAPSAPPAAKSSGKAASLQTLDALAAKGRNAEVVELADAQLETTRDRDLALQLELRRARALIKDKRAHSAVLGLQRTESRLGPGDTELAREVQELWGQAELKRARPAEAAQRFQKALACGRADRKTTERLQYGVYVALSEAKSPQAAAWKKKILMFSDDKLAAAEKDLLGRVRAPPVAPPAKAVATKGGIPSDPRELLPSIHTRAEWGAAAIRGDYDPMLPITRVCVHHSAVEDEGRITSPAEVKAELRQLQANHQQKWADLGYHFVIDPSGGIWEGRNLKWQGAHEGTGLNQGSIGVCLLGNFEDSPPSAAQLGALKSLLDAVRTRWSLTAADIKTHREVRPEPTACPGASLQGWVDDYRRALASGSLARQ